MTCSHPVITPGGICQHCREPASETYPAEGQELAALVKELRRRCERNRAMFGDDKGHIPVEVRAVMRLLNALDGGAYAHQRETGKGPA